MCEKIQNQGFDALFVEAMGQFKNPLVISCSDSKFNPNTVGVPAVRTLGAVVPAVNTYRSVNTINQITKALGVTEEGTLAERRSIVVCGHVGCGVMDTALNPYHGFDVITDQEWMAHFDKPLLAHAAKVSREKLNNDAVITMLAEMVVTQSAANLYDYPQIKALVDSGMLSIHGLMYDDSDLNIRSFDVDGDPLVPSSGIIVGILSKV